MKSLHIPQMVAGGVRLTIVLGIKLEEIRTSINKRT